MFRARSIAQPSEKQVAQPLVAHVRVLAAQALPHHPHAGPVKIQREAKPRGRSPIAHALSLAVPRDLGQLRGVHGCIRRLPGADLSQLHAPRLETTSRLARGISSAGLRLDLQGTRPTIGNRRTRRTPSTRECPSIL